MKFYPVLFHRPNNIVSKGIRIVTGSYWNHAGGIFMGLDNRLYLIEAVDGGVRLWLWRNAKAYYDNYGCEYKFCHERGMLRDYREVLGLGYEFMAFPKDFIYYSCRKLFGSDSKITKFFSNIDDKSKFVCFELISYLQGDEKPWGADGLTFDKKKNV